MHMAQFYIKIYGMPITSTMKLVSTGAPQGLLIGPLFFNIFIHDAVKVNSKFASFCTQM